MAIDLDNTRAALAKLLPFRRRVRPGAPASFGPFLDGEFQRIDTATADIVAALKTLDPALAYLADLEEGGGGDPIPGPQGEKGDTGAKGDTGDTGAASTVPGPAGPQGEPGEGGGGSSDTAWLSRPDVARFTLEAWGGAALPSIRQGEMGVDFVQSASTSGGGMAYLPIPAGNFSIDVRFSYALAGTEPSTPHVGVYGNDGAALMLSHYAELNTCQARRFNLYSSAYTTDTKIYPVYSTVFARFERSGTTYQTSVSQNGKDWALVRQDINPFTATRFGIGQSFRSGTTQLTASHLLTSF